MVNRDIVMRKVMRFRAALRRLEARRSLSLEAFLADEDSQDVVCHNLQIALQACIDVAAHVVADEGWQVPDDLAGLFDILQRHSVLDPVLADRMKRACRFRNVLVHDYASIDLSRVYEALVSDLPDLARFLANVAGKFELGDPP